MALNLGAEANEFAGSAGKIADGDTFWLCHLEACAKIRLCGINTPERHQDGYPEAKQALADHIRDKIVRCVQVGHGTPCDGRSAPMNRG
ncbi:MAG: thermonuclease family protein, partial [Methyloceanibacter sp.]